MLNKNKLVKGVFVECGFTLVLMAISLVLGFIIMG